MPTRPSSGVVACILLVSSRLDCPGISLAEVCKKQKMQLLNVVLDQLNQLMVLETPFDEEKFISGKNFGCPQKKKITNQKNYKLYII